MRTRKNQGTNFEQGGVAQHRTCTRMNQVQTMNKVEWHYTECIQKRIGVQTLNKAGRHNQEYGRERIGAQILNRKNPKPVECQFWISKQFQKSTLHVCEGNTHIYHLLLRHNLYLQIFLIL